MPPIIRHRVARHTQMERRAGRKKSREKKKKGEGGEGEERGRKFSHNFSSQTHFRDRQKRRRGGGEKKKKKREEGEKREGSICFSAPGRTATN